MAVKILIRRDTNTNWETTNPVLSSGELGYDKTNKLFKIGDGVSDWNDLGSYDEGDIVGISKPSITSPLNTSIDNSKNTTITLSSYTAEFHTEDLLYTEYEISDTFDFVNILFSSYDTYYGETFDTPDLETSTTYYIRSRYKSASYTSKWSTYISFTTSDSFGILGIEIAKIVASDGAVDDYFGFSVAVSSTKIVVGSHKDDDNGIDSGSVYIYDLDGANEIKVVASDGVAGDSFGYNVATSSTKIVVGAFGDDGLKGSVYIYDLDGTNELKLTASDGAASDRYGVNVATSDTKIIVGAYNDGLKGSVYIYDLDGTNELKLTASDGAAGDRFGYSVTITDTKIIVGSFYDDDNGVDSGSVYIYDLDGTNEIKVVASDGVADDKFGLSVDASSTKIVVGSYANDGLKGSVYIYDLDGTNEIKVVASDGAVDDWFGYSVTITDTKIIVGSHGDDDKGSISGSVYIYDLDGTNELKLTASDGAAGDRFGQRTASVDNILIVGAYDVDDNGSNSGAIYIFN